MKTFEKPLSAKEEKEYLEKYRNGDVRAGDVLIIRNMRLVAHMVKHYSLSDRETSELISIGTIGLIKAVRTFDCTKGNRLAAYAAKCIDNELLMAMRNDRKRQLDVSLQEPIGTDREGNEISIIDVIETGEKNFIDSYILKCDIEILRKALEGALTPREKTIIMRRYGLGGLKETTQRELAAEMSISRSYVSRIEKKAIEKLRDFFAQT